MQMSSPKTGVMLVLCHNLLVLLTCSAVGNARVCYNPVCVGAGGAAYDL